MLLVKAAGVGCNTSKSSVCKELWFSKARKLMCFSVICRLPLLCKLFVTVSLNMHVGISFHL